EPEEVKAVFRRRCLLIGRRFRLAHIRFGAKVIEVATFRSGDITDEGLIVRDNEWGTAEEDARRRDFTINGLLYDAESDQVIDYVGGFEDIERGLLRTIGHPETRFKQDPVRMLRLLKFKARFGLAVESKTEEALAQIADEIIKSSPARILEEIFRMLESGAAEPFFRLMTDFGMLDHLFPSLADFFRGPHGAEVYELLRVADEYNRESDKPLDRPVLAACLISPILTQELSRQESILGRRPHLGDVINLTHALIHAIVSSSFFQFPRRMRILIAFTLSSQYRIAPVDGQKARYGKLLKHRDFPLVLRFLELRSMVDAESESLYKEIAEAFEMGGVQAPPKRKRRRTRRRSRTPRESSDG
ncbi:MAG: polynucleotide adenylyltransferase PcnB, partial [Chlamydiia bacterium]|nr:polynucleotide adenylyltransferase PcnB [Chlamydiia bacterium]